MTQQTSGRAPGAGPAAPAGPPGTADPSTQSGGSAQVAREEAAAVARTGADAGKQVASTAAEQVGEVAQEARRQAGDLVQQARAQAAEQARSGQQKATEGLRGLASELHQMSGSGDRQGAVSDLAAEAARRIDAAADWIDRRQPGDLIEEVRGFARRRPGVFLAGAALAGVLVGRLTRGAVDASR
jgi:F0F1-type ATP synthase membrane subunit b/b'